MHRSFPTLATFAVLVLTVATASAGSGTLPPDVDLDPDRGMTFGRLGKSRLPSQITAPFKQSTRSAGSRDPAIDPYNLLPDSGRYDPSTGKIRGGLSDTVRQMRRREDLARDRSSP